MNWVGMVAALASLTEGPEGPHSYAGCLDSAAPVACIADLGLGEAPETELLDLIAAGAVEAVSARADDQRRPVAELAARIARGERPALSPAEAQAVLVLFSEVDFYDSGLPGDARAAWLWPIALAEPVTNPAMAWPLVSAAGRSERDDDVLRLARDARIDGPW